MRFITSFYTPLARLYISRFYMSSAITIANQNVPIQGCSSTEELHKVLQFKPFKDWLQAFEKQQQTRENEMNVESIEIQNVDYFGSKKIGFVKLKANVSFKDTGKNAPGIVFMVSSMYMAIYKFLLDILVLAGRSCIHVDYFKI